MNANDGHVIVFWVITKCGRVGGFQYPPSSEIMRLATSLKGTDNAPGQCHPVRGRPQILYRDGLE